MKLKILCNINTLESILTELRRLSFVSEELLSEIPLLFKDLRTSKGLSLNYNQKTHKIDDIGVYVKGSSTDTKGHPLVDFKTLQTIKSIQELNHLLGV